MMKAYLTRRYWIAASHRLHSDEMSAEENWETYGKCNNPYGHGHNYGVEITVSGQVDPKTGMICDLGELDGFVNANVVERFDHQNLNTLKEFEQLVPTSENLCEAIYDIVKQGFKAAHLEKVKLQETSQNSFEYAGGAEIRA
jgi:6-pyruvoyltetrahydropterin/6-carboxytetrahydropterin synthase